jgi:hypothetical protein
MRTTPQSNAARLRRVANVPLLSCGRIQKGTSYQEATSEPVVFTTGDRHGVEASHEARPSASTACWAASSGSALQITNRDQVTVSDRAHVGVMQANQCLGLAGSQNKLDFKTIGRVQVDDGS